MVAKRYIVLDVAKNHILAGCKKAWKNTGCENERLQKYHTISTLSRLPTVSYTPTVGT